VTPQSHGARPPGRRLGRLLHSPTLMPVLVFGVSGAGFALANLILARQLPEDEYALFTLVLALMNLGVPLAAVGLDVLVIRRRLHFGTALLARVLLATTLVGGVVGVMGAAYEVGLPEVIMIVISGSTGAAGLVAAAEYQRRHRFERSLALVHGPNLVLLLGAAAALVADVRAARPALLIQTVGFALSGVVGWLPLLREPRVDPGERTLPWREAFSLLGANASVTLLSQLDRLIIPHLMPLSVLATYGALSAVVGAFFRVLQRGIGYGLLPRLRAAGSVKERRRLVAKEARVVGALVFAGSLALWWATPLVQHVLLNDKYQFTPALVLASIVAGWAKIVTGFSRATVAALADGRELVLVNLSGWLSVALAVGAAAVGARWGLVGVIYGVGIGWMLRALTALAITVRHLRYAPAVPGTPPERAQR
jgi:O-antigen/teichoic acid export membrane protein